MPVKESTKKHKNERAYPVNFPEKIGFRHFPKYSYGEKNTGNMILQSENLITLKSLLPFIKNKVKCIYIDPPYNNQKKYNHYTDGEDHDTWLNDVTDRIKQLRELLSDDGSLWISIDDREVHYLKVATDQIFGRKNYVTTVIWQQRNTRENRKVFSNNHEYLLVYAKKIEDFKKTRNALPITDELKSRYKNPDNDIRGPWQSVSANVQAGHATENQFYEIVSPSGKTHNPPNGRCWVYNEKRMKEQIKNNNIWFGKDGNGVPRIKRFLSASKLGLTPETLWTSEMVGTSDLAKKHILNLLPNEIVFDTPKPEGLLYKILHISTNPHDLVLDAYLGSATTTAVAHKMGRNYIGIENGKHAVSHCVKRMKKVVKGEANGITNLVNWQGGGGFDFYRY